MNPPTLKAPDHGGLLGVPKRVLLKPGHSLMDWIRLGNSGQDLTGVGGKVLQVSAEELGKHNKENDIWMSLRGKVYNITAYMDFHPGGRSELMRAAGADGTDFFQQIHKWVNYESMLSKCFVGNLATDVQTNILKHSDGQTKNSILHIGSSNAEMDVGSSASMSPTQSTVLKDGEIKKPRYEYFQTGSTVTIVIYTRWGLLRSENVIVDCAKDELKVIVSLKDWFYMIHVQLTRPVLNAFDVRVSRPSGKLDLVLQKAAHEDWKELGTPLKDHEYWGHTHKTKTVFRPCTLRLKELVTPDVRLFCFTLPKGCYMRPPTGQHVYVRKSVGGMEFTKPYTVVYNSLNISHEDPMINKGEVIYLMIKIYPEGLVSKALDNLNIGDTVGISDPEGDFDRQRLESCSSLVAYAGGTGFTPMIRVLLLAIHADKQAGRNVTLVFYNKEEKDIIWYKQLKELAEHHKNLKLHFVLTQAGSDWKGDKGLVCIEHIQKFSPRDKQGTNPLLCVCGPSAFSETAAKSALNCGYKRENVHVFKG